MMTDIHSHDPQIKPRQNKVLSLQIHPNTNIAEELKALPLQIRISAGIHPWHASEWNAANISSVNASLQPSRVAFIGEIGLDKVCGVPFDEQLFVFEKQLQFADNMGKSVLIHNVGHQPVLLALKREYKRIPAWIIHGFRGKAQMAEQFLNGGFYLSFGLNHQPEALLACPMDRFFLETDESKVELGSLFQKVAKMLGISVSSLESFIAKNFETVCTK